MDSKRRVVIDPPAILRSMGDTLGLMLVFPLCLFGVYLEGSTIPLEEWWKGVKNAWCRHQPTDEETDDE